MADQLQLRGGTTNEHSTFTGALREVTVDTDKDTLIVHDAATAGGHPLLREDGSNSALSLGTAGTPSLKFTGDTNTGIYSPGADQVAISTGGTGRLFVDSNGNVGVGTASPNNYSGYSTITLDDTNGSEIDFEVNGTLIADIGANTNGINIATRQIGDDIRFATNAGGSVIEKLRITADGKLGLGTSAPSSYDSNANNLVVANTSGNAGISIIGSTTGNTSLYFGDGTGVSTFRGYIDYLHSTDTLRFGTGASTRAVIDSSGRVGIGTTSPAQPLDIVTSAADAYIRQSNGVVTGFVGVNNANSAFDIYTFSNHPTRFFTNNAERARIDGSGRLLVGTSSEFGTSSRSSFYSKIQVKGNTSSPSSDGRITLGTGATTGSDTQLGSVYFCDVDGGDRALIRGYSTSAGGSENYPGYLTFWTNSGTANPTERMRIDSSGRVGIGTTSPVEQLHVDGPGVQALFRGTSNTNGGIRIRPSGAAVYSQIYFDNAVGTSSAGITCYGGTTFFIDSASNGDIYHRTNGTGQHIWTINSGGSEAARIDSSGRLGLGTSTPDTNSVLHVNGGRIRVDGGLNTTIGGNTYTVGLTTVGNGTSISLVDYYDGGSVRRAGLATENSGGSLVLSTKTSGGTSNESLVIDSDGNVGIGTTSPNAKLVVSNGGAGGFEVSTGNSFTTLYSYNRGTSSYIDQRYDGSTHIFQVGGAGNEKVRIDSSGRLLVGTSSASSSQLFAVQGRAGSPTSYANMGLRCGNTPTTSNPTLGVLNFCDNSENQAAYIYAAFDPGTWTSGSSHPGYLALATTADGASSPTERMRIISKGYAKFSNTGSYNFTNSYEHEFSQHQGSNWCLRVANHHANSPYGIVINYANANPNTNDYYFLYALDNTAVRFYVNSNGGIANYQANNVNLCDEREKKNIEALDSTWGCLKNWDLKKFHYNEDADTDDKRYGVIAQQVAEHCPEVITDWVKQKAEDAVLDEDGNVVTPAVEEVTRMGVKEQQMMWMAIKALQEAQTRIETLEAEVAALKGA